jgi:hypothetical protein
VGPPSPRVDIERIDVVGERDGDRSEPLEDRGVWFRSTDDPLGSG